MRGGVSVEELREIIGKNIAELRSDRQLTQNKLAEILNYSDKAVSKWERGDAVPDIAVLKQLADYFGVTVDYLLRAEHKACELRGEKTRHTNKLIISLISMAGAWLVATVAFAVMLSFGTAPFAPWLAFIYAIPVTFILAIVFNSIWGRRRLNFIFWTLILWSSVLSVYLTVFVIFGTNPWILFITGIPVQIIIFFLPAIMTEREGRIRGGRVK